MSAPTTTTSTSAREEMIKEVLTEKVLRDRMQGTYIHVSFSLETKRHTVPAGTSEGLYVVVKEEQLGEPKMMGFGPFKSERLELVKGILTTRGFEFVTHLEVFSATTK